MNKNIDLLEVIKKARPNLKESSIKTYINNINKLGKEVGVKKVDKITFLQNGGNIIRTLQKKKEATQKTYLASIVVVLKAVDAKKNLIDFYTEKMNKLMDKYNSKTAKQEKTESQEKNWIELPELIKEVNKQGKEITRMRLWNKPKLTPAEFDQIQKYIVGMLYIGDPENPPLRNNYANMKFICHKDFGNLDKEQLKGNYLVDNNPEKKNSRSKFFYLGDYKTSGKYGSKEIKVGKKLNNVLNKWLKINETGYLLVNNRKEPMTPNSLGKYMNKVFEPLGKKIGVSLIRHIYISHHFPAVNEEKKEVADLMLHSVNTQTDYSKK